MKWLLILKKLKEIINQLDHKNLNNILDFEPTAENIVKFLQQKIKKRINTRRKSYCNCLGSRQSFYFLSRIIC